VLLDGENVAPGDRLASLVEKGLRPSHIIIFQETSAMRSSINWRAASSIEAKAPLATRSRIHSS
jgi:hypothetical protein